MWEKVHVGGDGRLDGCVGGLGVGFDHLLRMSQEPCMGGRPGVYCSVGGLHCNCC